MPKITSRQDAIQQAVLKSRKDWLHYNVRQEREIYAMLSTAAVKVEQQLYKYAVEGKIPPERLTTILGSRINPAPESLRGIMRQLRPQLNNQVRTGMRQSINFGIKTGIDGFRGAELPRNAKLGLGTSFIGVDGVIRPYDVSKEKWGASVWGRMNLNAMDHLARTQYGQITLSDRVWDITWEAEKQIRNRINTGVILGESVDKVAREIKPYLAEPNARFHRVTKDGRLVLSGPAKKYKPGRGVYRSAYQNARRLVRTENARAYTEGTIRYGQKKTWIKGWISRVGSSNPAPYDASVNGKFFPKDSPPEIPYHPNCMCYAETVTEDTPDSELEQAQSQAEYDKENAKK